MTQDFKAPFYPAMDDKSITTLKFDGVELAAIQGLNQIFRPSPRFRVESVRLCGETHSSPAPPGVVCKHSELGRSKFLCLSARLPGSFKAGGGRVAQAGSSC